MSIARLFAKVSLKSTDLLKVGAGGDDFMNEIFDTKDVVLSEGLLNDLVVC